MAAKINLRTLADLDLTNKKVLVRLDLNVPIKNGVIKDDTRIREAIPTIKYLLEHTNKIVLCSHLGRPDGAPDLAYSLEPVGARLAELLDVEVIFVNNYQEEPVDQMLNTIGKNQLILLENLRFHPGETANSVEFARTLAKGIDFYVNDAFGTAHRAHASTVGVPELLEPDRRAAGFLIEKEIEALGSVLTDPVAPFTVVMGGSKVSDKIGVILSLLNKCHHLVIGGAMAYTFLKYKGFKVGSSRVETDRMDLVESIFRNAEARNVKIHLPLDHGCASSFDEKAVRKDIDTVEIPDGLMGLDIGDKTIRAYSEIIRTSRTVLWNGPMGVFEWPAFAKGSLAIAKAMTECHGKTVIGGGDSVSVVNMAGVASKMTHVSTGGGASLEFLEGKTLPGIKILQK
jgi:phosphoglycerate kinase